jgi:hypothetical protein
VSENRTSRPGLYLLILCILLSQCVMSDHIDHIEKKLSVTHEWGR